MNEPKKLTKIPDTLAGHMNTEVNKGTNDADSPLQAILKDKGLSRPTAETTESAKANNPPLPTVERNGFVIYTDPTTQLLFEFTQLNNSEVDAVLTKYQFSMNDVNGKPIFPRVSTAPASDIKLTVPDNNNV